jgi:hypothetical protein
VAVLNVQNQAHPCAVVPPDIAALHVKRVDGGYAAPTVPLVGRLDPHTPQVAGPRPETLAMLVDVSGSLERRTA